MFLAQVKLTYRSHGQIESAKSAISGLRVAQIAMLLARYYTGAILAFPLRGFHLKV